jgi:glycosyltransferase AglI
MLQNGVKLLFKNSIKKDFISVIIPVFRDANGLRETLASLNQQSLHESRYEIIVVNDGGDIAVDNVCEDFNVKTLGIDPRRGSYFARNRAIEESIGEFLAFLDADISVPSDWLICGLKALENADYVGGTVIIDKNKISSPADHYEYITGFPGTLYMDREHFAVTANLFVRRTVFETLGGFDERLFSGGDNEFGKRVYTSSKYIQKYDASIAVIHPPRGFSSLVNKKVRTLKGVKLLNVLYPDRYHFNKPSLLPYIMTSITPPKIRNIRRQYTDDLPFSFFDIIFFVGDIR